MATNEGRRPVPRAIIEVRNLRKEFPVEDETVVALDRVNLSIPQGQICCIFGESGSGKSTLLNQLAGMEKPTRLTAIMKIKVIFSALQRLLYETELLTV